MKIIRSLFQLTLACAASAAPLAAQTVSSQCSATITQDACQKTIDIFQFLAPQLGVIVAGGNATIGVGGTIGGLGHVYVSARGNLTNADIPQADRITPSTSGAVSSEYPVESQFLAIPEADVSIGVFKGFPAGVTNVFGVDALVSASYLPSFSSGSVQVKVPHGSLQVDGGVRVGIVQESIIFPGIAVTYLRRGLPTVDIVAPSGRDTLRVTNVNVHTDSYRLVASKSLLMLGLAVGVGQDRYDSRADASAFVASRTVGVVTSPASSVGPFNLHQSLNRTTVFADASLNFPFVHVIGEVGETMGTSVPTYNTFSGAKAGDGRIFGALGFRLGL